MVEGYIRTYVKYNVRLHMMRDAYSVQMLLKVKCSLGLSNDACQLHTYFFNCQWLAMHFCYVILNINFDRENFHKFPSFDRSIIL